MTPRELEAEISWRVEFNDMTETQVLQKQYKQAAKMLALKQLTNSDTLPFDVIVESRKRILEARGEPLCPTTPIAPATHP